MQLQAISFELLFVVSIAAGFIGAMSGMGGGVVLIPVLTFLGMDIKHAIAISIVSVIATSSGSASAYVRDRITNLKVGMFLRMFTILGALAGAAITLISNRRFLFLLCCRRQSFHSGTAMRDRLEWLLLALWGLSLPSFIYGDRA